ncbi:hypothetical protein COLO4_28431 [Corchorus olitorius]|uniref:Uncharacterized protein n=1 Tax=Corchorus olitorius TaxID=93759 RepID=A0A1R3HL04_9ROSI|nr:hypothetical protein COLO4_28431 [Corchorus olitorius]
MAKTEDPNYLAMRQWKGMPNTYPCGSPHSVAAEAYLCISED